MATFICDHCGRVAGDFAGGSGSGNLINGRVYRVCHPNAPGRPDCYKLVRYEPLGSRNIGIVQFVEQRLEECGNWADHKIREAEAEAEAEPLVLHVRCWLPGDPHPSPDEPRFVRSLVDALRELVGEHVTYYGDGGDEHFPVRTLTHIAGLWSTHLDYREEWAA
jgi:hypothetical protein